MLPHLLYHSSAPTLYPTNTLSTLFLLRFQTPVRVSSVRVTPEGVKCPDGTGVTYPSNWKGQISFNVTPSNPVNALVSSEIDYDGGEWPVDYPIDMPAGVASRMMMLRAPLEQLTVSVYGYVDESASDSTHSPVSDQDCTIIPHTTEDFSWLWSWVGDHPASLLGLLSHYAPTQTAVRALQCLDFISEMDETVLQAALEHPDALKYLFDVRPQAFLPKIIENPRYALHPSVRSFLPDENPMKPLAEPSSSKRHIAAWQHLSLGRPALECLLEDGVSEKDLMRVEKGKRKSNLMRLIELGEVMAGKHHEAELGMILDTINLPAIDDWTTSVYLAKAVPRLTVIFNTLCGPTGRQRILNIPPSFAKEVVDSLLLASSEVFNGKLAFPFAEKLAKPFIPLLDPSDPSCIVFSNPTTILTPIDVAITDTSRASTRFTNAINYPPSSPSAMIHSLKPSSLLTILAPQLVQNLSSAISPPFGITASLADTTPEMQGASAWGGKVYTQHEFRSREVVGLGIAQSGRAASKHVDDYA